MTKIRKEIELTKPQMLLFSLPFAVVSLPFRTLPPPLVKVISKKIGFLSEKMWFFALKNHIFSCLLSQRAAAKCEEAKSNRLGAAFVYDFTIIKIKLNPRRLYCNYYLCSFVPIFFVFLLLLFLICTVY